MQAAAPVVEAATAAPAAEVAAGAGVAGTGLLAGALLAGGVLAAGAGAGLGLAYGHSKEKAKPYQGFDTMFPSADEEASPTTSGGLPLVPTAPYRPAWLDHRDDVRRNDFAAAVDMERSRRLPELGALPTAKGGDSGGTLAATIEGLRASMSGPVSVQGDVRGEATLTQTIRVEPSPLLMATVANAQVSVKMGLAGKLGTTMKGSNATIASVPPGLSSFKPTMSGR